MISSPPPSSLQYPFRDFGFDAALQYLYCKVLSLRNNGISACLVGGSSDLKTEERATRGEFPLVFITPEKVRYRRIYSFRLSSSSLVLPCRTQHA